MTTIGYHIHLNPYQFLDVGHEAGQVEYRCLRVRADEQIDVRIRFCSAARHRTEHPHVAEPTIFRRTQDRRT